MKFFDICDSREIYLFVRYSTTRHPLRTKNQKKNQKSEAHFRIGVAACGGNVIRRLWHYNFLISYSDFVFVHFPMIFLCSKI